MGQWKGLDLWVRQENPCQVTPVCTWWTGRPHHFFLRKDGGCFGGKSFGKRIWDDLPGVFLMVDVLSEIRRPMARCSQTAALWLGQIANCKCSLDLVRSSLSTDYSMKWRNRTWFWDWFIGFPHFLLVWAPHSLFGFGGVTMLSVKILRCFLVMHSIFFGKKNFCRWISCWHFFSYQVALWNSAPTNWSLRFHGDTLW